MSQFNSLENYKIVKFRTAWQYLDTFRCSPTELWTFDKLFPCNQAQFFMVNSKYTGFLKPCLACDKSLASFRISILLCAEVIYNSAAFDNNNNNINNNGIRILLQQFERCAYLHGQMVKKYKVLQGRWQVRKNEETARTTYLHWENVNGFVRERRIYSHQGCVSQERNSIRECRQMSKHPQNVTHRQSVVS